MLLSYSTYKAIFYVWMGVAVFIFLLLQKIVAPYGRHSNSKWGPQIENRTGWVLMEAPAFFIMLFFLLKNLQAGKAIVVLMIGLYCFHYLNRSFIYPFRLHTRGKKMPVVIVLSAIFFNLCNTLLLGYYFSNFANYDVDWLTDIRFISGAAIFIIGMLINWKADTILIGLRKPGETGYQIPRGWLFELVSSPNLLGELIEWAGFAILCWNMPAVAFFTWTAANLVPRAMAHHQWYQQHFKDYPAGRKAILPYIA